MQTIISERDQTGKPLLLDQILFTNYLVSNFRFKFKFVNGGGNDFIY